MTHLTPENLIRTCEVAALNAPHRVIMASIGASEDLIYHWRTQSMAAERAGIKDCIWYFEWRTGQFSYWHQKIPQARVDFIQGYEAELRQECRYGRTEIVLGPDQQIVYKLDPRLVGVDDEELLRIHGRTHRYLLDEDDMPVPLTKQVFPPAPIRLRILEQDRRYLSQQNIDVHHSGEVVHTAQTPQRRVGENRPDVEALRALAKIPPKNPFPLDDRGNRTIPKLTAPRGDDRPDHVREQQPERPSYAKPPKPLDQASVGRGAPPDGGFKVA
jgi:hypothetical protein